MAAFTYEYRVQGLQKVSAQIAGEECERLGRSAAGLSPETLLDASRDAAAPLHNEFEWDDEVAAEKYRLRQARAIIQNIVCTTVHGEEEITERAFVSVRPNPVSAYVSLQSALSNDEWKEHLLKTATDELKAFRVKYGRISQLAGVIEAIDAL